MPERAIGQSLKTSSRDAVDLAGVLERLDGDRALFDELTHAFEEECPNTVDGMRRAIASHDGKSLEHLAHTLKGSSASVGGLAVSEAAGEIERLAHSENLDNTRDQFTVLQMEIERMFTEFEVLRQG